MSNPIGRPSDVATLDAILHVLYEVISGPAGHARDWDRFRSLFLAGGRLIPIISIPGEEPRVRLLSVEEYIQRVEPLFTRRVSDCPEAPRSVQSTRDHRSRRR